MDVTAAPVLTGAGAPPTIAADLFRASRRTLADGSGPVRATSPETPGTTRPRAPEATERPAPPALDGGHAAEHTKAAELMPSEVPVKVPEFGKGDGEEPGVLKFDVQDADVLARFAIHEETNHVVVTMYQRETGEVIREFPPRQVLDVMAALAGKGLAIDVSR